MPEYKLVRANEQLLQQFIMDLQEGAASFRYYKTRPLSIITHHLTTLILTNTHNYPVAYGHLEKENNVLWLGIAVADNYKGLGLGKQMMHALIDTARKKRETAITLSVDNDNKVAQQLYHQFGFTKMEQSSNIVMMKLPLK
jgi:GNAT superfamily N-acetyltransferase